jgi:hypothetical protein
MDADALERVSLDPAPGALGDADDRATGRGDARHA